MVFHGNPEVVIDAGPGAEVAVDLGGQLYSLVCSSDCTALLAIAETLRPVPESL